MRSWIPLTAVLLAAAAKGDTRRVLNHAKVLAEPKYWAKSVSSVDRGQDVKVLGEKGGWIQVELNGRKGFVPQSAFVDDAAGDLHFGAEQPPTQTASAAQAANASRGFSKEANAQDVSKDHLEAADAWIAKYESADAHGLDATLAAQMPRFLADGRLDAAAKEGTP
jgi:hypothetical protein